MAGKTIAKTHSGYPVHLRLESTGDIAASSFNFRSAKICHSRMISNPVRKHLPDWGERMREQEPLKSPPSLPDGTIAAKVKDLFQIADSRCVRVKLPGMNEELIQPLVSRYFLRSPCKQTIGKQSEISAAAPR